MRNEVVEIFGIDNCPFCTMAIQICEENYLNYNYKTVGKDLTKSELLEIFPTAKTVPIVVIDGQWIGGYQQLKEFIETENAKDD